MRVVVLSENTVARDDLGSEHGLSLYIETNGKKILMDTGASVLFYENSLKIGVDLTEVDLAVISHGHYDHGGGLKKFLEINKKAKIYIREKAFEPHFSHRGENNLVYIGLDKSLKNDDRFVFTTERHIIDSDIEVFSNVKEREFFSEANSLMKKEDSEGKIVDDCFEHEQNLIIRENGKNVLFCGCAHCGIINILNKYHYEKWEDPAYVFGGFHLTSPSGNNSEPIEEVRKIGYKLREYCSEFFTCHCTGKRAYEELKDVLKERINYISAGNVIDLCLG